MLCGRHQLADMEGERTLEDAEALLSEVRTTARVIIAVGKLRGYILLYLIISGLVHDR